MNQILRVSLVIIIIAVALVIGGGAGYIYEKNTLTPSITKAEKITTSLNSQVIRSVLAFGTVSNISGKTITLTSGKDSLAIVIKNDAQVYSVVPVLDKTGKAVSSTQKSSVFSDVKKGSKINVSLKFLANGQAEGNSVVILP